MKERTIKISLKTYYSLKRLKKELKVNIKDIVDQAVYDWKLSQIGE